VKRLPHPATRAPVLGPRPSCPLRCYGAPLVPQQEQTPAWRRNLTGCKPFAVNCQTVDPHKNCGSAASASGQADSSTVGTQWLLSPQSSRAQSLPQPSKLMPPTKSITHDPHACFIFEIQTKSVYIHRDKQCPAIAYSIDVSLFTYSAIKHNSDRQIEV